MTCSNCLGTGKEKCTRCEGTGKIVNMFGGIPGSRLPSASWSATCPECGGRSEIKCRVCHGTGEPQSPPPRPARKDCTLCNGSGKIRCKSLYCRGSGSYMGPTGLVICSMCGGSGRMTCDNCMGIGYPLSENLSSGSSRLEETEKPPSEAPEEREIDRDGHFIAYSTGIVEDTKTGLEWFAGPDRDMTYQAGRP